MSVALAIDVRCERQDECLDSWIDEEGGRILDNCGDMGAIGIAEEIVVSALILGRFDGLIFLFCVLLIVCCFCLRMLSLLATVTVI